jgi:hypothetical protein
MTLAQIWPRLNDMDRQALTALATANSYTAAANMLGLEYQTFANRVRRARTRFLALWHEGETPSRIWRVDRRERTYELWNGNPNRGYLLKRAAPVGQRKSSVEHGTWSRYCGGCRCESCRDAARAYNRAASERRKAALPPKPPSPEPEHGSRTLYRRGCRCEPCTTAERNYYREYRARKAGAA